MADVHELSPNLDATRAAQLLVLLEDMQSRGVDLGPRMPHIRVLSESLNDTVDIFKRQVGDLAKYPAIEASVAAEMVRAAGELSEAIRLLVLSVRSRSD